ncbi:unnamed protein product, partial [Heterosigma akashiwo]
VGYQNSELTNEYSHNCFTTAAVYCVFLAVSIFGWMYDIKQKKKKEEE